MTLKCTDLITVITHTSDFIEVQSAESISPSTRLVPSIVQPPTLELKPLPEHLKYAYLEEDKKLPVIISTKLDANQETRFYKSLGSIRKQLARLWQISLVLVLPCACTKF